MPSHLYHCNITTEKQTAAGQAIAVAISDGLDVNGRDVLTAPETVFC